MTDFQCQCDDCAWLREKGIYATSAQQFHDLRVGIDRLGRELAATYPATTLRRFADWLDSKLGLSRDKP